MSGVLATLSYHGRSCSGQYVDNVDEYSTASGSSRVGHYSILSYGSRLSNLLCMIKVGH